MAIDILARGLAVSADQKAEAALAMGGGAPNKVFSSIAEMISALGATATTGAPYKYTFTDISSVETGSSVYLTGAGDPDFWVEIVGEEGRLYEVEIDTSMLDDYVQQVDDNISIKSVSIKNGNGSKFSDGRLILRDEIMETPYGDFTQISKIEDCGSRGGLILTGGDNYMKLYSEYDYPGGFEFYSPEDGFTFYSHSSKVEIKGNSIQLGTTFLTEDTLKKLISLTNSLSEEDINKLIKFASTLTLEEE